MTDTAEFEIFIQQSLLPAAHDVLRGFYTAHCEGRDIGIETKADASPASLADRTAEQVLRDLILKQYPDHGVWGEEFGAYEPSRDFVWVLDPLDGTREFLAKRPHCFGVLIGLLHQGRAVAGSISDPLNGQHWIGQQTPSQEPRDRPIIACTNPVGMFGANVTACLSEIGTISTHLNCIGFAHVADGKADAAVECGLGLHDIAALIPVLSASGCLVLNTSGQDYTQCIFDLPADGARKYSFITSRVPALAERISAAINS